MLLIFTLFVNAQGGINKIRWFVGGGLGDKNIFSIERTFFATDLHAGITYDSEKIGRTYIYANLSYAFLNKWFGYYKGNQYTTLPSSGYALDFLINADGGIPIIDYGDNFRLLLMIGGGIGVNTIKLSANTPLISGSSQDIFFLCNINTGFRLELQNEHVVSFIVKPQVALSNPKQSVYFNEVIFLLNYTFWNF